MTRVASCSCGKFSVVCAGEPEKISLCHCFFCQRRTGSTYGIAAFYARAAVTVRGESRSYTDPGDSGSPVTYQFCPQCGSTVLWEPQRKPGHVAVAVGAFADSSYPAPTQMVNVDEKHHWVDVRLPDAR